MTDPAASVTRSRVLPVLSMLVAVTAAQPLPGWMTGVSRPDDLTVSLITFSPGDDVPEWWGHAALVVEDRRTGEGRLYNYGMFSFDQGFFGRFIRGRLEFWVSDRDSIAATYRFYKEYLNRDVRVQELNLLPEQALQIAKALGTNVLPENRTYLYQHYTDNCATRPRDLIDAAVGGQLKAATAGPARMTLREHTLRYSRVNPPMAWVLDYLQNASLDGPLTQQGEAYLPDELERQVQALVVTRPDGTTAPLVKRQYDWFKSNRPPPPERPPNWLVQTLLVGLAIAALGHGLAHLGRDGARWARVSLGALTALLGLVFGVFGSALAFLALFTDHLVAHRNENLFFINPLSLALLPLGVMLMAGSARASVGLRRTWWALAALSVLGIVVKVLPGFTQANWNIIALAVPVNVGFALLTVLQQRFVAKKTGLLAA